MVIVHSADPARWHLYGSLQDQHGVECPGGLHQEEGSAVGVKYVVLLALGIEKKLANHARLGVVVLDLALDQVPQELARRVRIVVELTLGPPHSREGGAPVGRRLLDHLLAVINHPDQGADDARHVRHSRRIWGDFRRGG